MKYPFSIVDAVKLIDPNVREGSELKLYCPVCQDHKKRLYVNASTGKAYCHNCGFSGNVVELYRQAYGLSEWIDAFKEILDRLNLRTLDFKKYEVINKYTHKEPELADIDTRDKVYRNFLAQLPLNKAHQQNLLERGFKFCHLYRSTPAKKDLAGIVRKMDKFEPEGIPGFYKHKKSGAVRISFSDPGIFVPYFSIDNKLQGLQVRRDSATERGKYSWFSSSWANDKEYFEAGSGGSFVHYACDFENDHAVFPVYERTGERAVVITEGAMKADIAHQHSNLPFIALPGVNASTHIEAELKKIKEEGVETIYNAFDMDYISNEHVKRASDKLEELIKSLGFKYKRSTWDPQYKGIDDYLVQQTKA